MQASDELAVLAWPRHNIDTVWGGGGCAEAMARPPLKWARTCCSNTTTLQQPHAHAPVQRTRNCDNATQHHPCHKNRVSTFDNARHCSAQHVHIVKQIRPAVSPLKGLSCGGARCVRPSNAIASYPLINHSVLCAPWKSSHRDQQCGSGNACSYKCVVRTGTA